MLGKHVSTLGCFYHLTQSTRSKVQELGLRKAYHCHDEVRILVGMTDSLALLPTHHDNIPEDTELDYVQNGRVRAHSAADDDGDIPDVAMRRPPSFFHICGIHICWH